MENNEADNSSTGSSDPFIWPVQYTLQLQHVAGSFIELSERKFDQLFKDLDVRGLWGGGLGVNMYEYVDGHIGQFYSMHAYVDVDGEGLRRNRYIIGRNYNTGGPAPDTIIKAFELKTGSIIGLGPGPAGTRDLYFQVLKR